MTPYQNQNTVFITQEETDRIRKTVQQRVTRCGELHGYAREPRDPTAAVKEATGASLMADMGGALDSEMTEHVYGQKEALPVLAVGMPYPPCTAPAQQLQPMTIANLQMDIHHRGRRLAVKRVSPVVSLAARSWTMVQDAAGEDVERLEICLHKSRYGKEVLESKSHFIVKEPYFTLTEQGEPTIRIDHPSDIVPYSDAEVQIDRTQDAIAGGKAADECKARGNAALRKKDLIAAYTEYTDGLKLATQMDVAETYPYLPQDLSRNRAYVNLLLDRLDEARTDAVASLIPAQDPKSKILNSKAYFRAGCAAYNLGEYREAKRYFENQRELCSDDKDAIILLRKVHMRLQEEETGIYDLRRIRAGLTPAHPGADVANFTGPTEVKNSPGRGRGLFATRDIPVGQVVTGEKAFCVLWGHQREALTALTYDIRDDRIRVTPVGLAKSIVQKLLSNPSQMEMVLGLYGDYKGGSTTIPDTVDGPVVDVFEVLDIISRNAFGLGHQYGGETTDNASTGLWIRSAYINHSCVPNTVKECIGDLLVFRSTHRISAGEEIFHAYDDSADYDARSSNLMATWGFECGCALCEAEKADGPVIRTKRKGLMDEANAFMEKERPFGAKRLMVAKAKKIGKAIEETYDGERYKGLPKVAGLKIQSWLAGVR